MLVRHATGALFCAGLLIMVSGCFDSSPMEITDESTSADDEISDMATLERLSRSVDGGVDGLTRGKRIVFLPAGSVDALQDALDSVGHHGAVILQSGTHTESLGITINESVAIVGQPGAVLMVTSDADPADTVMDAALHVLDTKKVTIWGLEIRPTGDVGGVAILVEDSKKVLIGFNRILDHQNAVMLHHGDHSTIWGNHVVVTGLWQTGVLAEADGIICVNGKHVKILANDVSNGFFGVFTSDRHGQLIGNHLHHNFIGLIFCKVPVGVQLPGGEIVGSDESATQWTATLNDASDNANAGMLVIDGAQRNVLTANAASGNGTYGIELVGESTRFGFCTPTSFENTVRSVGPFGDVVIKDCGEDNVVIGGDQVDTSLDPCDAPCPANVPVTGRFEIASILSR